jgi:hypothetical protein
MRRPGQPWQGHRLELSFPGRAPHPEPQDPEAAAGED